MAIIKMQLYSDALFGRTDVAIILPTPSEGDFMEENPYRLHYPQEGEKFQTLWLLHGICHNAESWLYDSDIVHLAEMNRIGVVIPSCGNSFYHDIPFGPSYFQFLTQELPKAVYGLFPLSKKREDNFICGFSMGGYGAFHIALEQPERFCAAVSMSGAFTDIASQVGQPMPEHEAFPAGKWLRGAYGDGCRMYDRQRDDVVAQLKRVKDAGATIPALYMCCGTEDDLLETNREIYREISALDVPIRYEESRGVHRWEYWNQCLPDILEWLPLKHGYVSCV